MPGDPKECMEHATNCLRLAAEARSAEQRQHFEELAQRWLALARDLEFTQTLLATWGDPQDAAPTKPGGSEQS